MREMLIHYEHTIDQKDQTEKNLNKALNLLSNKTIAYHYYYEWRLVYIEKRQQEYSLSLAKRFYEEKIKRVCVLFFYILVHTILLLESINKLEKYYSTRMEETF
jgi:hypothetical protein